VREDAVAAMLGVDVVNGCRSGGGGGTDDA